ERVNGEFELHPADVSVAKHLHKFTLVDDATGNELVLADLATLREHAGQIAHVHRLVLGTEAVVETTQLRKPHVDGHLPTLKADRYVLPSLSALRTAARRLTALGSRTATNADRLAFGTRRRLQVVDLEGHYLTASTVTRCRTACGRPRTRGVSSRTTACVILRSRSVRSDARWACLVPIVLLVWVI